METKTKVAIFLVILLVSIIAIINILPDPPKQHYRNVVNKPVETEVTRAGPELIQSRSYNYIQAPHFDIRYSTNDGLKIQEIIGCSRVTGMSMQPSMFTGNTYCYMKYKPSMKGMLREGMIIEFIDEDGGYTVHRIRAVYDEYLIAQGDNNKGNEEVAYENITKVAPVIIYT